MRSTMMDVPLTVTSIMRYGTTAFRGKEVVTSTGDGTRRESFADLARRAARLAHALRRLDINGDQRVATFMWNNAEHLEAYLAVPSMGAVLHTLNIRLAPAQIGYIATHAEDTAAIVDASLVPLFAEVLPHAPTIRHVLITGTAAGSPERRRANWPARTGRFTPMRNYSPPSPTRSGGRSWTRRPRPPCATRAERPATRKAWSTATARSICTRWAPAWETRSPFPNGTACSPSSRCSTSTRGGSRSPRCCAARP